MDINARRLGNEKKYNSWEALPGGGRRYFIYVEGKHGWKARYVKEVSADEETIRFFQEVYDGKGTLVEIHEKFPIDKGHKPAKED
jgi:hypothetical protein